MPQLDVSTFVPQLFWLGVFFIALLIAMTRIALPQVRGVIVARSERIDGDLDRAASMKAEANEVMAAYESALATARAEAQATMRETAQRAAAEAAERHREIAASLAEQIDAAERRIAATKAEALGEIRGIAVDVARSITEKLVGAPADASKLTAAVESAMSVPGGAVTGRVA